MRQLESLLYLLFIFFMSSCASLNRVEIDVLNPAQYKVKEPIGNLAIFNNSHEQAPEIGHSNYTKTIVYNPKVKPRKLKDTKIEVDSTIHTCLYNLHNELNASGLYSSITLDASKKNPPIAPYNTEIYFENTKADAILVLERLAYTDKYTSIYYKIYQDYEYETQVIAKSNWRLYFAATPSQAYSFSVRDTFYWDEKNVDRADCVLQTVWKNGKSAAQKFSPYWKTVNRLYYTNVSYIYKEIDSAIKQGDWQAAAKFWKTIYDSQKKDNKTKARMAYNLALYFELKTDFETALLWLNESHNIFTKTAAKYEIQMCNTYIKALKKRQKHQEAIEQQFGLK